MARFVEALKFLFVPSFRDAHIRAVAAQALRASMSAVRETRMLD